MERFPGADYGAEAAWSWEQAEEADIRAGRDTVMVSAPESMADLYNLNFKRLLVLLHCPRLAGPARILFISCLVY